MSKQKYIVYVVREDIHHLNEISTNSFGNTAEKVVNGNVWSAFSLNLSEEDLVQLKLSIDYLFLTKM